MPHNTTTNSSNTTKVCNTCNESLDISQFARNSGYIDGYRPICKKCREADYQRRYYKRTIETRKDYKRQYFERNRENYLERKRKNYRKNVETIRKQRKLRREATGDIHSKNRRARINGALGKISSGEWLAIMREFDYSCAKCGSTRNIQMDHVIPLSKGGAHEISNIQPLCETCNKQKYTRVEDFRGRLYRTLSLLDD